MARVPEYHENCQQPRGCEEELEEKGDRMIPLRPLDLSLFDEQRDPTDLFIEVDHVLDVERHPFCLARRRSNRAIYVQDRVGSSREVNADQGLTTREMVRQDEIRNERDELLGGPSA